MVFGDFTKTTAFTTHKFSLDGALQLFDLADTFEIIPLLLHELDSTQLDTIRVGLRSYQAKYPGVAYDYLSILGMDEQEFQSTFPDKILNAV